MSQALQPQSTASYLLANREQLSLEKATSYLVGRLRTRTPLGACEYLMGMSSELVRQHDDGERYGRELFDARVELAVTCVNLYETVFPREFKASPSPAYSVQREHEFYRLINERLFPLAHIEKLDREWTFFYPGIPVIGQQNHDWTNGCCPFEDLQIMFKLVLVLSGRKDWRKLLDKEPAPPHDAPAWTFFRYALAVEPSPLRHLHHAFDLTCYKTGNPWLDAPRDVPAWTGEEFMFGWSSEGIAKLFLARLQANEINARVAALETWFQEDPKARVARAVELWNQASEATAREDGRRVYV